MNKSFEIIRQSLIDEAKNSPILLSDLAGLETYVSESYNSRSFIELLQHADDAGASSFFVKRHKDYLFVANNGRTFNSADLESLCRSASSNKVRGSSIGYRGIGFKSVVSFAKEVHLVSGDYQITFSKELSKQIIPQAPNIPLIRIPHFIKEEVINELSSEIIKIQNEGYQTIFIFTGATANQIDEEYTSFANTTLLFLNNIRTIRIELTKRITANIAILEDNNQGRKIRISTTDTINDWFVCSYNNCKIAFSLQDNKIVKLPKNEAIIHAFLPTEDTCGMGVILNGDFSTDPSRRHLILDDTTKEVISNLVLLYATLLKEALENKNSSIVNALIPYFDLSIIQLMKPSFEKEFIKQLKDKLGSFFSEIKLSPHWFNAVDYAKMMEISNQPFLSPAINEVAGVEGLMKYLGSKSDSIESILGTVNVVELSMQGYAQIAVASIKSILMNHDLNTFSSSPIFMSNNKLCSLKEINDNNLLIDDSFVQLMKDNGILQKDIGLCLKKLHLKNLQERQFKDEDIPHDKPTSDDNMPNKASVTDWFNNVSSSSSNVISTSIQKWRSAEENTLNALNSNGFSLRDVSNQNVGYDLEGKDPNSNYIYIEVKSVEFPGQKFRMTNNEYAVAQYKQDLYYLAIVYQSKEALEISLIKNPINNLHMGRQCVQWVWECSDYDYKPMKFPL